MKDKEYFSLKKEYVAIFFLSVFICGIGFVAGYYKGKAETEYRYSRR